MPGTVSPDPFPLTPDERHRARGDLGSATDRRKRAFGYGGAAVDKWLCERPFADGRAAVYEHWRRIGWASGLRHARLHDP